MANVSALAQPPIEQPANDHSVSRHVDRWAVVIMRLSAAGFTSVAIHARECRMQGWDVDAYLQMMIEIGRASLDRSGARP